MKLHLFVSAAFAATVSLFFRLAHADVAETNRINVTARTQWAQATTVDKLPAQSDWGYKYSFRP